ncbi:hypothetical protein BH09SUM1_BH09SUM1_24110 [soil metagenome]
MSAPEEEFGHAPTPLPFDPADMPPSGDMSDMPTRRTMPSEGRIPILREGGAAKGGEESWIGKKIGPYTVQQSLSRGGMGRVLLAYDEALRRQVALKVMDNGLIADDDALQRFEREARATAAIQHRNIATVYLVGRSDDGAPFLAMEYVDDGSLMDAIRQRRAINFSQASLIMEQVASGLEAAHRQNVIHRDVKPANIMMAKSGDAKVVDFGLAKIFFEDSYVTKEGMVLGTPSYMAPEQSQGRVVDHRADIYAFGATFYHLISGRPPFTGDSNVQIMMKHVTAPLVPMRSINPAVPIEFDDIVGRCMRKDIDERYQSYEALLTDIKRLRLQCMAREQGSLIGVRTGSRSSGSVPLSGFGGGGAPSSMLPAPPQGARRSPDRILQSGTTAQMSHGAQPYDPQAVEHGGWTPVRMALTAGAALIIIAGIGYGLFGPKPKDRNPDKAATALAMTIKRLNKHGDMDDAAIAKQEPLRETMEILSSLREGLVNSQSRGDLPKSLSAIADEKHVLVNFKKNGSGLPLDAWGSVIGYSAENGELRSAGVDTKFYNADDIVEPLDGVMNVPPSYSE